VEVGMSKPIDPLHGKTLETILNELLTYYGWEHLGTKVNIRCFNDNPSVKSSLTFLRKTPWARKKVEDIYKELKNRD
jgi:uncharacterized protein (DUF2132 family)